MSHISTHTPPLQCFQFTSDDAAGYLQWQVANFPVDILLGINALLVLLLVVSPTMNRWIYATFNLSPDDTRNFNILGRTYVLRYRIDFREIFETLLFLLNIGILFVLVMARATL